MRNLLVLVTFLSSFHAQSGEFRSYIEKLKGEVRSLLGQQKPEEKSRRKLPPIPVVKSDPLNTDIYNKNGKVYQAGERFKKLPAEKKRNYHFLFLKEIIQEVRGAEATNEELSDYLNVLEQGGSREGIYRSLIVSSDYKQLELYDQKVRDQVVEYGFNFGVRFLGIQFNKEDMAKLNLWTIKRVIVDKTLEVIDAFPKDGTDLYLWYGILSSEMSSSYKIWQSKLRLQPNVDAHIKWAKGVPIQHLKSEVIIKLNKIFNHLQEN